MIRIVIAEDENVTRQWLRKKIEELSADYKIVGIFENGKEAFSYCRENKVDVVFTDIRMPVMDGLELLKNIDQLDCHIYKVILSAYDEFSYAREAIKLGVQEFLLKPEITKEELDRILKDAKNYLQEEKRKDEDQGADRQQDIWDMVLGQNNYGREDWKKLFSESGIQVKEENMTAVCVHFETSKNMEKIADICEIYLDEKHVPWSSYRSSEQEIVFFYQHRNEWTRRMFAEELYRILEKNLGEPLYVGVSTRKSGYEKIKNIYEQANLAKDSRIFYDKPGVSLYDEMRVEDGDDGQLYYSDRISLIRRLVGKEQFDSVKEQTEKLFEEMEQTDFIPGTYVKALCNEILTLLVHEVRGYELDEKESRQVTEYELMSGESELSFRKLKERMELAIDKLCGIIQKKSTVCRYSDPVRETIHYLDTHYGEKIAMDTVAEEVHLSKAYLSILFKKETGEKFSDYLLRIRLEHAMEQLGQKNCSVSEIAEHSGFFDSAHFSRAFKEKYGFSPVEYRKERKNRIQENPNRIQENKKQ